MLQIAMYFDFTDFSVKANRGNRTRFVKSLKFVEFTGNVEFKGFSRVCVLAQITIFLHKKQAKCNTMQHEMQHEDDTISAGKSNLLPALLFI